MSLVLTKAALALKNAENNFQVVKFEAHKAKKKKAAVESDKIITKQQDGSKNAVDLKKIRHEVVKFGMSGFVGAKKEEAKIALAVSLGAKPPKKEYVNYKELMKQRKLAKEKEKEEKMQMMSKSILQMGPKRKKKGVGNDVGHFLSGYGKVQKKDLKKDDKTKKKKGNVSTKLKKLK